MKKHWYDYLWIWTIIYFALGFFNILFAWLGMIDFLVPLFIAIIGGNKVFCNRYWPSVENVLGTSWLPSGFPPSGSGTDSWRFF